MLRERLREISPAIKTVIAISSQDAGGHSNESEGGLRPGRSEGNISVDGQRADREKHHHATERCPRKDRPVCRQGGPLERKTLSDLNRLAMERRSFALVLLGIAAVMAVTLSIIGVYGVLAHAVAQRRKEISIRVAVGAEPRTIKALFLRQGLILTCLGGAVGLVSARGVSHWMSSLLFGVTPADPLTFGVSGAVILAAALAASYVPSRRAASLHPIEALRSD